MHRCTIIAVAVLAAALSSSCSSSDEPATVSVLTPSTSTVTVTVAASAPAAPATATPVSAPGKVEFKRADTGAVLGSATLPEVRRLPATCASDPVGAVAQLVAVHSILSSAGEALLPRPDTTTLIPVDEAGTTYEAQQVTLETECRGDYPAPGAPVAGGRSDGWTVVAVPVAATQLRYYPIITEGTSFVKPAPLFAAAPIPA
ncbi:hypothetical protein [Nocardia neocaledoniensis]|uniref:hypothetical protein n=1 Tax=Nocardia neocaledoniensis TaxID=236511 RepID=UPI002456DB1C|nr:hypothetical protein [Nocardia neocaledoniensis]